ncbi:endoglucanase 24-like protein, partial [Tanacetum coccineum]
FEKEKLRADNERMAKEKESVVRVSLEIDSVAQWLTKFHGRRQLGYQANNRTSGDCRFVGTRTLTLLQQKFVNKGKLEILPYTITLSISPVPVKDHDCWEKLEDMDTDRTVYTVHAPNAASDVAGEMEAALAASSIVFRQYQLLRIEEELGAEAVYAGANFRKPVEPY